MNDHVCRTAWRRARVPVLTPGMAMVLAAGGWLVISSMPRETAPPPEVLGTHPCPVNSLAYDPGGSRLLVGGLRGAVALWDLDARQGRVILPTRQGIWGMTALAPDFSALGVTSLSEGDAQNGEPTLVLVPLREDAPSRPRETAFPGARSLAFSPRGDGFAVGLADGTVALHDADGRPRARVGRTGSPAGFLAYSGDGSLLAAVHFNGEVVVWEVAAGRRRLSLPQSSQPPTRAAFSLDRKALALSSPFIDCPLLLDLETGETRAVIPGEKDLRGAVAFSPDGRTLAMSRQSGSIVLWDLRRRGLRAELKGHQGQLSALAFSPDGRRLASGGNDMTVRLWELSRHGN